MSETALQKRLAAAVADITERYRQAGYFPSASVRVFNSRETLAEVHTGDASADSVFDVASLTKIATALQALRLISAGSLRLTDTLSAFFPEIAADPLLSPRLAGVTVRSLLTHTSGLPAWYPFYVSGSRDFFAALKEALSFCGPEKGVVYSDLGFMLLGRVLERVRGKPLERCLKEDLAEPLGLGVITYRPDPSLPIVPSCWGNPIEEEMCRERGLAFSGFRPKDRPVRGETNDGNAHYFCGDVSGHAGIFAAAEAYERLCRWCMTSDDPLIAEAQREQPDAPGRGLGFQTGLSYPHGCGHTGFTGTGIYFSRKMDIGAVSFTNRLFYREENSNATWEFRRVLHETALAAAGRL